MASDLLFWGIIGALSVFLILKSSSYALDSIVRYAQKTRLSYYFVGLLIVSIGTSLPEIFTSIISSLEGKTELVLGDAMGATIVDITLVLAMVAIVAGKLKVSHQKVGISWWKVLVVVSLPLVLALDGRFSRMDGVLMLGSFTWFYGWSIYTEIKKQKVVKSIPYQFAFKETFIFGVNIGLLILGVQFLVMASFHLAAALNIPLYLFGAVLFSIFTSFFF